MAQKSIRNPIPKTIQQRDVYILYQLTEKISLTLEHIHSLAFKDLSVSSAYKTIARLKLSGFIYSMSYERGNKARLGDLYFISTKGLAFLQEHELYNDCSPQRRTAPQLLSAVQHRLAIIDYWISLEQQLEHSQQWKLHVFVPEFKTLENGRGITLKAINKQGLPIQLRNDALFVIKHQMRNVYFLYALEIDRSTMPIISAMPAQAQSMNKTYERSSLQNKFQKMQNLLLCGDQIFKNLGEPYENFSGMRVIFVTSTGKHLINTLEKISINHLFKDKNVFLFSHQQEIKTHGAWHARYALKSRDGAIKTTTFTTLLQQH